MEGVLENSGNCFGNSGLPQHPQHALAQAQMRGYSSLFSFETYPITEAQAFAFAERLHLFRFGL